MYQANECAGDRRTRAVATPARALWGPQDYENTPRYRKHPLPITFANSLSELSSSRSPIFCLAKYYRERGDAQLALRIRLGRSSPGWWLTCRAGSGKAGHDSSMPDGCSGIQCASDECSGYYMSLDLHGKFRLVVVTKLVIQNCCEPLMYGHHLMKLFNSTCVSVCVGCGSMHSFDFVEPSQHHSQ